MSDASHWSIFLNAALINNFVLAYFLGICPFFGVSAKLDTAVKMGGAVGFVMLVASVCAYLINILLAAVDAPYLRIISYILVISSTVQLVEMLMKKLTPATFRAMGIFLPLITTNCAILGLALFQTNRGYDFTQSVVYSLGAGAGFAATLPRPATGPDCRRTPCRRTPCSSRAPRDGSAAGCWTSRWPWDDSFC